MKRAKETVATYNKRSSQVSRMSKGNKSLVITEKTVEFNIDQLDLEDLQDSARQLITKKANFPTDMIGVLTKAERINFSKDKRKEERNEIVVDVQFVYDLEEKHLTREIGGDAIDYSQSSIRFHMPKRYQDTLEGLVDRSVLVGGLILSPKHDKAQVDKREGRGKKLYPALFLLVKSKKVVQRFGLTSEDYPSVEEFIEEGERSLQAEYETTDGPFKVLFDYFRKQATAFIAKESHKTNYVK